MIQGKALLKKARTGKKRYLFSYQFYNTRTNLYSDDEELGDYGGKQSYYGAFYALLLGSGTEFINYEKKQSHFDSPAFISLLETLKELKDRSTPDNVLKSYKTAYYTQLKEGSILAVCDGGGDILSFGSLDTNYSFMQDPLKEELALYPFPTFSKSDRIMAEPLEIAAVNSNSENKKAAYDFIKKLISIDVQKKNQYRHTC